MRVARLGPLLVCALLAACAPGSDGSPRSGAGGPKLGGELAALMAFEEPERFRAAAAERGLVVTAAGVVLDIRTEGLAGEHRARLELPGLRVRSFRPEYERIDAVAERPAAVRRVAELPFVRAVTGAYGTQPRETGGESY